MEDYEKKYKDALAKAREIHRNEAEKRFDMEWLFPELGESEDEMIRKALVDALNKNLGNGIEKYGTTLNAALAWLEKQGEQKSFDYESANIQQKDFASVGETATIELSPPIDCGDRIYHVSHKPIEKNDEQKPVIDFKAKNWYVSKVDSKIHDMTYNPANKVESKVGEKIEDEIEIPFGAKDSELQEVTYYIPKGFYAEINDDKVVIKKGEKPATWSDEDEKMFRGLSNALARISSNTRTDSTSVNYTFFAEIDWLKSLKQRYTWKPSEEQMQVFEAVYNWYNNNFAPSETLTSLYNDLKKL